MARSDCQTYRLIPSNYCHQLTNAFQIQSNIHGECNSSNTFHFAVSLLSDSAEFFSYHSLSQWLQFIGTPAVDMLRQSEACLFILLESEVLKLDTTKTLGKSQDAKAKIKLLSGTIKKLSSIRRSQQLWLSQMSTVLKQRFKEPYDALGPPFIARTIFRFFTKQRDAIFEVKVLKAASEGDTPAGDPFLKVPGSPVLKLTGSQTRIKMDSKMSSMANLLSDVSPSSSPLTGVKVSPRSDFDYPSEVRLPTTKLPFTILGQKPPQLPRETPMKDFMAGVSPGCSDDQGSSDGTNSLNEASTSIPSRECWQHQRFWSSSPSSQESPIWHLEASHQQSSSPTFLDWSAAVHLSRRVITGQSTRPFPKLVRSHSAPKLQRSFEESSLRDSLDANKTLHEPSGLIRFAKSCEDLTPEDEDKRTGGKPRLMGCRSREVCLDEEDDVKSTEGLSDRHPICELIHNVLVDLSREKFIVHSLSVSNP